MKHRCTGFGVIFASLRKVSLIQIIIEMKRQYVATKTELSG